jgi:hypothetical protein
MAVAAAEKQHPSNWNGAWCFLVVLGSMLQIVCAQRNDFVLWPVVCSIHNLFDRERERERKRENPKGSQYQLH